MLRQDCSADEDSDSEDSEGETLYTETESEESDEETQSDTDFIDDSELTCQPPITRPYYLRNYCTHLTSPNHIINHTK